MFINGVGRQGEDVNVADDFSIHVPYGWCYDVDEYASGGEPVFTVFHPASRPNKYREGSFDLDDNTSCEMILKFIRVGSITVSEDATEMDMDIDNILERQSDNAKNITINTILGGVSGDDDDDNEDGFRRMYKVVKDNPFLKAGYYTSGLLGRTVYNVMLITSHHVYSALQIGFLEDDYEYNEKKLEDILSTIEPLNVKEYQMPEEQEEFSQPTYIKKIKAKVGPLTMMLPDGFEYVTKDHIPQNDSKAENALGNYAMVAAPADCKGGLRNFRDAYLGINVSESQHTGLSDDAWKNIGAIKKNLNSNDQGRKLKYIKEGVNFLIGYGKGNECEAGDEPYWVSYLIVILCGSLQYTSNLFFNSKKASVSEYTKAVEAFCSNIQMNADDLRESEVNQLREEIGDMLAKNGRLNGVLASQLYTKDIIFNNDDEVTYDGTHTIITGFQLNAAVMDNYPGIVNHVKAVVQELKRVISFVEQNENLMIPKSKFHPNILKATRGNPITGATIFELCAWHMLLIAESDENKYTVAIDNNLIKGIPDAFAFVGEFIKTLRTYNEIYDDFEVTYASTLNADGPCGNISSPVRGAVTGSANTIKVNGGNKDDFDGYATKLKEIDLVSDEDYTKAELQRLEKKLDAGVIAALKAETKDAKALFKTVSAAIKSKNYKGLSDIDAVIDRVNEAVDESYDIMSFNLSYMYRPFVNSYEIVYYAQKVVSDADLGKHIQILFTENTFERGVFDPNEFPKSLSNQMDGLTEEDIYKKLLESANYLIGEGNQIISTTSVTYIQKQLDEWGNDFEAQGTQYEGRIDRIEKVNVGDKLTLKREPDNEYDSNAIDLRASSGSIGHLPAKVAELLSPAFDGGTITAVAEVIKVEPLSKRSKRAKKPLLNVKIVVTGRDTLDSGKGKKEKESKISSEEKKRLEEEARKKAEAEAEDKRKKAAESSAMDLAKEARRSYMRLEKDWQERMEDYQNCVSSKTYMSIDEVTSDMSRIVQDRNRFGTKYDDLIKDIDTRGKEYIEEGCSYKAVGAIRDAISEIIKESSALNIDFSTSGMLTAEIGSTIFSVSYSSKGIQRWWNSKYEDMPEVKAEKQKRRLNDDLRSAEKAVAEAKKERIALDSKEKTLEQDIPRIEKDIEDLKGGFDASKSQIEKEADSKIKGLQSKIEGLKSEKAAAEKSIEDIQTQIAGLSLFKFRLKKELTQKVENTRVSLPKFTEDIRRLEADCEDTKKKCSKDVATLQQRIDDEKRNLTEKKRELSNLPGEKSKLDTKIANAEKKVEDLKFEIAIL